MNSTIVKITFQQNKKLQKLFFPTLKFALLVMAADGTLKENYARTIQTKFK